MSLKDIRYFLERAASCDRLAEKATDPQNRETFQFIASQWRAFAAEYEGSDSHKPHQIDDDETLSSLD